MTPSRRVSDPDRRKASRPSATGPVTVTAVYTAFGVTKTATKMVTITPTLVQLDIGGPSEVTGPGAATYTATATFGDETLYDVPKRIEGAGPLAPQAGAAARQREVLARKGPPDQVGAPRKFGRFDLSDILDPKHEYLFTGLEEHKDKINEFRPWLESLIAKR